MSWMVDWIRRAVVLVLLMEVVLQLQAGKQYESYLKTLVGIMVVYSVAASVFGAFSKVESLGSMKEFQWIEGWFTDLEKEAADQVEEVLQEQGYAESLIEQQIFQSDISEVEVQVEVSGVVSVEQIDIGG